VDLIASVFGVGTLAGDHDGAPLCVHLHGMLIGGFERQEEERSQHFHHVVVGVVIVIEQDDVKERFEAFALGGSDFGRCSRGWQPSNGRMKWKGGATDSTGLHPSWEVVPGSELP